MLAKNVTEIKLFIKELDGKNRSDRNTYILVRNCREGSMFCDVHFTKQHKTKSTYFYITVKVRFERRGVGTYLLFAGIGKALSICDIVGCRYILVDSKKESIGFYEKYGFKLAEKNKKKDFSPMYLNMQPIVAKLKLEKSS